MVFKNLKNNEFKHIWDLIDTNGGHRYVFVTADLNNQVLYKIVSLDAGINTTIPNNLRTKIYTINGHTYYENLWRFNPNLDPTKTDVYKLLGQTVSRKPQHFVINPNWTQQRLLEEMAHAYKHKVISLGTKTSTFRINGVRYTTVRTIYKSAFSDCTIVEIIHSTRAKDPVSGLLVNDHISLLAIKKPL